MAEKKEKRFVRAYQQSQDLGTVLTEIWVDAQTGVNYLFHHSGYAGGLTPLLNRDGTPVITAVPRDEN